MEMVKVNFEFFLFHPTEGNIGSSINLGRGTTYQINREHVLGLVNNFYKETGLFNSNWVVDVEMIGDKPKLIDGCLNILSIIS